LKFGVIARFDRAIQYAAVHPLNRRRLWNARCPVKPGHDREENKKQRSRRTTTPE
jgi:hypothetical protein